MVFRAYDLDLRSFLHRRRDSPDDYPTEHKVLIPGQMWVGLAYLHSISIVHRDIKLANILIRFGSRIQAVLADMGLAVDLSLSLPSTVAGDDGAGDLTARVCSGGYVTPELVMVRKRESASYGPAVDVWSGAVVTQDIYIYIYIYICFLSVYLQEHLLSG